MNTRLVKTFAFFFFMPLLANAQGYDDKKKVLEVVQYFFNALQQQDTITLRKLFLNEAMNYYVQRKGNSVVAESQSPLQITFSKDRVIVERMRADGVTVQVHLQIAVAWVPYDLWINGKFSHCGVDVFTMIRTREGWKISSLSFTREFDGCEYPKAF